MLFYPTTPSAAATLLTCVVLQFVLLPALTNSQAATMTQLETAMAILMKVFDTYACAEGKSDTLTKAEAKTLLEKELPALIKVQ